jgi:hypothetical protein
MRVRTMLVGTVMLIAASSVARAQDESRPHKPTPKAARMPAHAKLADGVKAQQKVDAEPSERTSDRPPAAPVPARDVTDLARTLKGSYACTGTIANQGGGQRKTVARLKVSTDLDGAWIGFDLTEQPSDDAPFPVRLHVDRTYCSDMRMWTSVMRDNSGGLEVTTSEHGSEESSTWLGGGHRDGARVTIRVHEQRDDHAGTLALRGEVSSDGRTFVKEYDLTCAK